MDLFDKHALIAGRHGKLLQAGADPFGVRLDQVLSGTEARINGRDTILVGTNNYLGLTFDPDCMAAAVAAIRGYGTGTTGSRIANGTYGIHRELEAEIAGFLKRRSAIVFPTGYQANLGMLVGLAGPRDVILMDADSHSSIYDGCRLSGATGRSTSAHAATAAAHGPAAFTTVSHSIVPRVVSIAVTRLPAVRNAVALVSNRNRTPRRCAPSAYPCRICIGAMNPSFGQNAPPMTSGS